MASTSNPSRVEELAPSTSTSTSAESSMPAFDTYKPPTTKLAFKNDKKYHVFLSFRGPDVRKSLVDHLFEALSAAGLNVFLDSEKLEKGEMIGLTLEKAIERSAIRIPIFSKGYADSVWCLKEAAAMLSTPALIIPLFYHVDPTHVRYPENESSPYKQSFLKHYGHLDRYTREEIDGWKDALLQICSRSGWSMDMTQGFEARLVKTVVNDLMKTLDRVPLQIAKHPVGIDSVKNVLIQKLNVGNVGIWGIGGIGKTTVAKAVYNQLHLDFEAASFVSNVRATAADATGLLNLQKQILEELAKYGGQVYSVDKGISLFRDRLGGKRVLLILDDVDDVVQLDALVGDWLAPGSRVIITSRDKHIFNVAGVSFENIHEMSGLEINEGLQLFSWHAFLRASPSPSHEDLSKGIVEACKGHPLSLEVIGSFLYDKQDDTACWTEALRNITFIPDFQKRVHHTLKISYNTLSKEEREIFVDIACFFIGEDKTLPIVFWKSLYRIPETAVSNLSMKLLIKVDNEGVFDMHDLLRDLGRTIAEEEKSGTRIWEAAHLSTISNDINISRLRLNGGNPQSLGMLYIPGLRYLHLQNVCIEDMTEDMLAMLPPSLIWLRLEGCTLTSGETSLLEKPRHSRFMSNIRQLKIMQLKHNNGISLIPLLSFLNVKQMQHLELRGWEMLNNLLDTIGNLSQLQHLDLGGCRSLHNLPDTIGDLSQLQHLDLGWCESLNNLPDTIGNLSQLRHLELKNCRSLNNLPDTIGNLLQLRHLGLTYCGGLNNLPYTIGNLSQLRRLDMARSGHLSSLPDTIGNLSQLQHLDLHWCYSLSSLPDSIGNLSQLQHLDLRWCKSLNSLPDTIGNLSQLQHLDLEWCGSLNSLPDTIGNLSQLQHLHLGPCGS